MVFYFFSTNVRMQQTQLAYPQILRTVNSGCTLFQVLLYNCLVSGRQIYITIEDCTSKRLEHCNHIAFEQRCYCIFCFPYK